jgi:hypothetical protein
MTAVNPLKDLQDVQKYKLRIGFSALQVLGCVAARQMRRNPTHNRLQYSADMNTNHRCPGKLWGLRRTACATLWIGRVQRHGLSIEPSSELRLVCIEGERTVQTKLCRATCRSPTLRERFICLSYMRSENMSGLLPVYISRKPGCESCIRLMFSRVLASF